MPLKSGLDKTSIIISLENKPGALSRVLKIFELSKVNLSFFANNPSKESAEEEIAVDYSGDELEIGFNISYIQESLSVIDNPEVEFVFFGSENSCIIKNNKNDNLVHVIMPMRLWFYVP